MASRPRIPGNAISRLLFVVSLLNLAFMFGCFSTPEVPADLQTAKIDYGKAEFTKKIFDRYTDLGLITDLRYSRFNNDVESELAVVGTAGAVFVGPDQRIKKAVHYANYMSVLTPVVLLQAQEGGVPLFLARGTWYEARLFDQNGAVLWRYRRMWGINDAAGGALDGAGRLEFAVGVNLGGVRLLDQQGRELWRTNAGSAHHLELASSTEGAPGRIIHSDWGALTIRKASGEVVLTCHPVNYVDLFSLIRWAGEQQPRHLVFPGREVLVITDLNGHQTARLRAPGCEENVVHSISGTPVCFTSRRCYQATLIRYSLWDRSVLYLHDQSGKLSFREVFDRRCGAVGTMPAASASKDESLLVGCTGEVWKYDNAGGRLPAAARD